MKISDSDTWKSESYGSYVSSCYVETKKTESATKSTIKKKINKMCYKDENWKSAEISHVSMATRKWDAWIMPGSLNSFICIRMQLAYRTIEWPIKRVASFWPKNNFHTSHTHTHTQRYEESSRRRVQSLDIVSATATSHVFSQTISTCHKNVKLNFISINETICPKREKEREREKEG